jgi:uncharacterized protein YcfJ
MKKQIAASALLSLCLLSANAMANDAILGAVLGGGAGAFVGHSIGGRDATIIGGAIGAAAGAAIASDNGRRDRRHVRVVEERRVTYVAQPTYYAPPPPPVYHVQPVRVVQAPVYYVHGRKVSHHHYREWQRERREHRRDVRYYGY